jgi:hypothetical protein
VAEGRVVTKLGPKPEAASGRRRYQPPLLRRVGTLKALTFFTFFRKGSFDSDFFDPFIRLKPPSRFF